MNLEEELKHEGQEEPAEEKLPRYVVRDAAFALAPQKPLEWVIEQLISAGSVSLFYGEPGSKKTYALLSLAVCVALGKPWLGFTIQPQKVLIIDEESGERRLTLRIGAALRGEIGDEDTPLEFVSLAGFMLDKKEDAEDLQALIEKRGAGLVIIDALADVMTGDENSKQDTQPVFTTLRRIAEKTNAAIIVIHHSNRKGGYRGSSAIKGALDLMVKIISDEGSHWIQFKSEKSRDIEAVKFTAKATWTEDQFYLSEVDEEEKPKPLSRSQKYIMRYLEENGPSPLPDIMGAADSCSPQAAKQAVYALVDKEMVYRANPEDKGRGAVAIYAPTNEEKEEE
jgi:hypothetical protein